MAYIPHSESPQESTKFEALEIEPSASQYVGYNKMSNRYEDNIFDGM